MWKATTVQTAVSVNRSVIWISVCLPLACCGSCDGGSLSVWVEKPSLTLPGLFQAVIWCSLTQPLRFLESVLHMLELSSCWSLLCPDRVLFMCIEEPCFLLLLCLVPWRPVTWEEMMRAMSVASHHLSPQLLWFPKLGNVLLPSLLCCLSYLMYTSSNRRQIGFYSTYRHLCVPVLFKYCYFANKRIKQDASIKVY